MDKQKEGARLDEDNIDDRQTDVTRSENQQRSSNANELQNISTGSERMGDGSNRGTDERQSGSHQEGNYDRNSDKPMVDKEDAD